MATRIVAKPIQKITKLKRPKPLGWGRAWRALDFTWHEDESRKVHTVGVATGMNIPDAGLSYFWSKEHEVKEVLRYMDATGQRPSFVTLHNGEQRIGGGFLPPNAEARDIAYLLTLLKDATGYDARLWYTTYSKKHHTLDYTNFAAGALFFHDIDDPRVMPVVGKMKDLPAATFSFSYWDRRGSEEMHEYLVLRDGETMPQRYAGMFFEKRDASRKVLAEVQPENFMIYSAANKWEHPTQFWELRADRHFWCIGSIDAPRPLRKCTRQVCKDAHSGATGVHPVSATGRRAMDGVVPDRKRSIFDRNASADEQYRSR
jgi:hypothetical protein